MYQLKNVQDSNPLDPESETLRCKYTDDFPMILMQLGISLAVSTYQAGKVILISSDKGTLRTQAFDFTKPMGIAIKQGNISIGDQNSVWYYRKNENVDSGYDTEGQNASTYDPRHIHYTGDIDIHEMAWGHRDLWIINTKYSTLCTVDGEHTFTPHWRPHFVTESSPEDRCHLNGLAMQNGLPKYVTALSETDKAGGWRENKRDGGILMDVESNTILARGLSMPHSPRLYDSKLWMLESGNGSLGWFDPKGLAEGKHAYQSLETVTQVPGFTRGLDFAGPYAFIGLSQVRESATFSGIPLVETVEERKSGVWIVHIETGQIIAYVQFLDTIQEIFAVQVLPTQFPTIQAPDHRRQANH